MSEHDHLIAMLNRLKRTALRDQLDSLIDEAGRQDLTIRDALALFCEREIARRDQRRIDMSFGLARFPFVRDLAGFDFGAQPSIDRAQVREIATGRFIANGEAVLFLGPPGVGKTHLAVAIGREAIVAGYTVLFAQAPTGMVLTARGAEQHTKGTDTVLAWINVAVQITVYSAEVNVVLARRLWPRAMVQPPLTEADRASMALQALQNQRREEDRKPQDAAQQREPGYKGLARAGILPEGDTMDIARADVAHFLVEAATDDRWVDKAVQLGG